MVKEVAHIATNLLFRGVYNEDENLLFSWRIRYSDWLWAGRPGGGTVVRVPLG
jgi:hypothetical protein